MKVLVSFGLGVATAFLVATIVRDHETRAVAIYPSLHSMALYSFLSCDEVHDAVCLKHDTSAASEKADAISYEQMRRILCRGSEWKDAAACREAVAELE